MLKHSTASFDSDYSSVTLAVIRCSAAQRWTLLSRHCGKSI